MTNRAPSKVVSANTARAKLGQIMEHATARNQRFVVDRRGKPAVVIMSMDDYIDTFAPSPAWLNAVNADAKAQGLDKITMKQINAEVAAVRAARRARALNNPKMAK